MLSESASERWVSLHCQKVQRPKYTTFAPIVANSTVLTDKIIQRFRFSTPSVRMMEKLEFLEDIKKFKNILEVATIWFWPWNCADRRYEICFQEDYDRDDALSMYLQDVWSFHAKFQ